jgi:alpha-L-arabinofuranosidase
VDTYCAPSLGAIRALDKVPYLDVSATLSPGKDRLAVFMVNRHREEEMTVDLEWSAFPVQWAKLNLLTASSPSDRDLRLEKSGLPVTGSSLELTLPSHSIAVVVAGKA